MVSQDVAFLPSGVCFHITHFLNIHGIVEGLWTVIHCRSCHWESARDMLFVAYLCSNKCSFLCQMNFMEIIVLLEG